MPETMKLYSEFYMYQGKPSIDPFKTGKKFAEDFIAFTAEFEKRVNDVLKDGWTLVNTNIANQGVGLMMTAVLKKQV